MHLFTCVPKPLCAVRAQVEQVADPALPVAEIVRRCPARQLMELYRVPAYADADEFLRRVAAARGKLRKGGVTDTAVRLRGSGGHAWRAGFLHMQGKRRKLSVLKLRGKARRLCSQCCAQGQVAPSGPHVLRRDVPLH